MGINPTSLQEAGYIKVPLLYWVKDEPTELEFKKYVKRGDDILYIIEATYYPEREYGRDGKHGSSLAYTVFTTSLWLNEETIECEITFSAEDSTPPLTLEQVETKITEYHSLLGCGAYCRES